MVARPSTPRPVDVEATLAQAATAQERLRVAATALLARLGLRRDQVAGALARLERHPSLGRAVTAARRALAADSTPEPQLPRTAASPPPMGLRV